MSDLDRRSSSYTARGPTARSWSAVIERLQGSGYHVTAPQFPSRRWQLTSPGSVRCWPARTDR